MTEDRVRRMFDSLELRPMPPDPEFVASLRQTVHDLATSQPGAFIDTTDDSMGEPIMVTLEERTHTEATGRDRPSGRSLFVAAAAAVAAIAIAAGIWAASSDRDEQLATGADGTVPTSGVPAEDVAPLSAIPVDGLEDDPAAAEAFAVVEAVYAAYNAGDTDAWSDLVGAGQNGSQYFEARSAAGSRIEVSRCVSNGFDRRPDDQGEIVTGHFFTCELTERIPFYEAGGLDPWVVAEWVVADGRIVDVSTDEAGFDDWLAFSVDFRDWMFATYPEVYREMTFLRLTTAFPSAESMPTALEYVDEFVEASPNWPPAP